MSFSAKRLRALREDVGLTQEELATLVGKKRQTIYEYETGKHQPGSETILALSQVLNTNASFLLNETSYSGPMDADAEAALAAIKRNNRAGVAKIARQRLIKELKKRGDIP